MRAAWRLAINSLSARPRRAILLTLVVALSGTLIASVACAMASIHQSIRVQIDTHVGTAEARIRSATGSIDASVLETARSWEGVEHARAWLQDTLSLTYDARVLRRGEESGAFTPVDEEFRATALAIGMDRLEYDHRPLELIEGRLAERPGEVVLDAMLAERLSFTYVETATVRPSFAIGMGRVDYLKQEAPTMKAPIQDEAEAARLNAGVGVRVGDEVQVRRLLRRDVPLRVVGIAESPPLGGRPRAFVTYETLATLAGKDGVYTEIELELADGVNPNAFVGEHEDEIGEGMLLTTTERVTSGVEKNMSANQLGFILGTVLASLSAAFIILTGLTTGVAEQQRELGVLRSIGATQAQLAGGQLLGGMVIGGVGALIGVPLGVLLAWTLVEVFRDKVPSGLALPWAILALAVGGALFAGLLGAAWPAWQAARTSVVRALANRASPMSRRALALITLAAAIGIGSQLLIVLGPKSGQIAFWGYATTGLPLMFIGYFLAGVPLTIVASWVLAPVLTRVLRLPPGLLGRSVRATPYRHGFTAGAMMVGLALMVDIWTTGGGVLRDWLGKIKFPDAFVSGVALPQEATDRLRALDIVEGTSAISMHNIDTDAFGVHALQHYTSTYFAFEPRSFFDMAEITWVEGDEETAVKRLEEGGAVIVAREFKLAQGLGAGDTFTFKHDGKEYSLQIVGVVTSPGLELVSKFFNIGDDFVNQAVHGVFGTREDARKIFGTDAAQLIQVDLVDGVDDEEAIHRLREAVFGLGVLDAGSGRQIREQLELFVRGSLLVFSTIAVGSMLVACLGVANLIAAGIDARSYELGVLRAVGAGRGVLTRLVLGEAMLIVLVACLLGTFMGMQGSIAAMRLYSKLLGIGFTPKPAALAILAACGIVAGLTLGAAAPAVMRLNRKRPIDLLGATPA
ncbi:MAG: FtsX-like permease family protein [Phycisphaerales bacterium]